MLKNTHKPGDVVAPNFSKLNVYIVSNERPAIRFDDHVVVEGTETELLNRTWHNSNLVRIRYLCTPLGRMLVRKGLCV